jgi:DNA-binding MarR family transcriptional regulator
LIEKNPRENLEGTREELLQRAIEQLFSVVRQMHRDVSARESQLSHSQARLVFAIARYQEQGISVKDLAKKAGMTPGAITQFVDVLIAKGLVRREEDPTDRRMVRLNLTPPARSQMARFRHEFLASAAQTFAVLNAEELQQLIGLLSKVTPRQSEKENGRVS